jgi:hypothetical protein
VQLRNKCNCEIPATAESPRKKKKKEKEKEKKIAKRKRMATAAAAPLGPIVVGTRVVATTDGGAVHRGEIILYDLATGTIALETPAPNTSVVLLRAAHVTSVVCESVPLPPHRLPLKAPQGDAGCSGIGSVAMQFICVYSHF